MNFMKRNKFYLLLIMMACICWGCKSKNMNTVTNKEAESTIVENSNDTKTNDNESKEESAEESVVQLSDFINPEGNTLFTRFITPKDIKEWKQQREALQIL